MRFPWSSRSRRVRHKPLVQLPFLGREAVLAALDKLLEAAREGTGQYAVLAGPSGSGKSALLTEFALMSCHTPEIFRVSLHAGECLGDRAFSLHLLDTLRVQSETRLQKLYTETKRLRKDLSVEWDEAEFCHILASADWFQLREVPVKQTLPRKQGDPLRQLLTVVHQHPWAVGAATMLDVVTRQTAIAPQQAPWVHRWGTLLQAVRQRCLPDSAVLVLLIDQVEAAMLPEASAAPGWRAHWQAFTEVAVGSALPLLVVWAGTDDGLQPVRQGVSEVVPLREVVLPALNEADQRLLIQRLHRGLPRAAQEAWQRLVTLQAAPFHDPSILRLTAIWVAAGGAEALAGAPPDVAGMVNDLVRMIERRHPEAEALLHQLLAACAFLVPSQTCTVEDFMLLCDLEALGLDPLAGRTQLEALLGDCVRYGLVAYEVYDTQYIVSHGAVQAALQSLLYPQAAERQAIARYRRLATAVIRQIQRGEGELLGELAQMIEAEAGDEAADLLTPYVVLPLRRLLPQSSKAERRRMAQALGTFRSRMAVDLLTTMLNDTEDEVRSRAVQSLADLEGFDTRAALLTACCDANSDVRWIAAMALGKIEDNTAVDALIGMLTDDDKEVGRIAAQGLGSKGDSRAVPHLIAAMRDSYPLLRESAALALGRLDDRRALSALQDLLQDSNRQVRRSAETALAHLSLLSS
ncbi:hypothetical protein NKDENANG_02299 [Candidatus Entotheonellaceae bacterium PAL068K]